MKTKTNDGTADREILLTRVVEAPRALVWKVWTDPEHVIAWWGPTGFTTVTAEMKVEPGGRWQYVMRGPDGHEYPNRITYLEVVEPERLVYEHSGEPDLEPVHFRSVVTFEALGPERTRVTLHSIFPSPEARDFVVRTYNAIEGGKQHLARLDEYLAGQSSTDAASPAFVLHRVVAAPRALVYDAWTQAEHLAHWFGPKGCTLTVHRLELRPGGLFHYHMQFPGGLEMWGKWVFREIVPNQRLVFAGSFSDAAGNTAREPSHTDWPLHMLSTVTFEDHAGTGRGTVVTLKSVALEASAVEQKTFDDGHGSMRQGWGGTFEQLVAYLADRAARGGSR